MRVAVKPELLRWARERADADINRLVRLFPKYCDWENGDVQPTLRQLERFANTVYVPIGTLFLSEPQQEPVPIPDFRTIGTSALKRLSPNLLDTIYLCQQRQEWYLNFVRKQGESKLSFVGESDVSDDVDSVAARMRNLLGLDLEERKAAKTWTDALRSFIKTADSLGILVMVSGVVGNNSHRKLNPEEFRGFALVDEFAPLVFINGADTKAAQMFTLAHELAHVWLGKSAISDSFPASNPDNAIESWCNQIAAELLVPLSAMCVEFRKEDNLVDSLDRLARIFKVSTLVVLRRIFDAGYLTREKLNDAYNAELIRIQNFTNTSGGNFYLTQSARVSSRFCRALIADTLEGGTLYTEALRLLGIRKLHTFNELARQLDIA